MIGVTFPYFTFDSKRLFRQFKTLSHKSEAGKDQLLDHLVPCVSNIWMFEYIRIFINKYIY